MDFPNNFHGKLIRLRAVEPSDWEILFARWHDDVELDRTTDEVLFPMTREGMRAWTEAESRRGAKNDEFRFQIVTLAGELVGTLVTHHCNPRAGTFMYGISIDKGYRRKGYAVEAIQLVLRYFFEEKRYQKVNAEVYSFNEPSITLHERLGFTLEGRLRRMVYTGGQYFDALMYGMTSEEFASQSNNEAL